MRRIGRTAAATAVVLTLGACALDDDERAVARGLAPVLGEVDLVISSEVATCTAETWVGEIGTGPFLDDGLANQRFQVRTGAVRRALHGQRPVSRTTAEGYAVSLLHCLDFDDISLEHRDDQPPPSAEQMDEYADCLRELDRSLWRSGLAATMMGQSSTELDRARTTCEQQLR